MLEKKRIRLILGTTASIVIFLLWVQLLNMRTIAPLNLGVQDGQLSVCPDSPNCVSSQAADQRHAIAPLLFSGDGQAALEKIDKVLQGWPGVKITSQASGYLRAEFTSTLFRFIDDVEFVVVPNEGVIHFRSCSRIGYSDLGANRRRMESLRKKLNAL
jgi:uncharacterized protein (DUF1499 family)